MDRKSMVVLMTTVALDTLGLTMLPPVAPFLVAHYVPPADDMGFALAWLAAVYSIFQFLAAPGLGSLSDRVGRRPVLVVCLLGSAAGYLLLGIGGALWVLFLGRAIDGLTGANTTVIIAYIADRVPESERTQFYGKVGALGAAAVVLGPAAGGLLSVFGYRTPMFVAAAFSLANAVAGYFFLPESLSVRGGSRSISLAALNPFTNLKDALSLPAIRWILVPIFFYTLSSVAIPSNIGLFSHDLLGWNAASLGLLFSVFGVVTMLVQGLLIKPLRARLSTGGIAMFGLMVSIASFAAIALVAWRPSPALLYGGIVLFAIGDGLTSPSLLDLTTRATRADSHGRVQGANQSVQSLAQIVGPILAGYLYDHLARSAPYIGNAMIVALAVAATALALQKTGQDQRASQ